MDINFIPGINPDTRKALVFIGGSGDTKTSFSEIINILRSDLTDFSFCSYDHTQDNKESQVKDLEKVCDYLIQERYDKLTLFCTSMGAYATCHIATNPYYSKIIQKIIFCDPADYYLENIPDNKDSWSGWEDYAPTAATASDQLTKIQGDVKADVVYFNLRNHGPKGYCAEEPKNRSNDSPADFPRLNRKMVESFFQKLPDANKGKFFENSVIPHAFNRDGNISENHKNLSWIIKLLITEH